MYRRLQECRGTTSGANLLIFRTGDGCTLENSEQLLPITAHRGGSVLLPCSCTDLQTKPEGLIWRKYNESALLDMSLNSDQYRNRVQLFNNSSPRNLSLLISHLTEDDGGEYECAVEGSHIRIRLTLEDKDHSIHFFILTPVLLLLLGLGGVIYWRYRGRGRKKTESREQRMIKKEEQKTQVPGSNDCNASSAVIGKEIKNRSTTGDKKKT
ncbi:hypothetical protein NFI96_007844 [Prochilodus magdalenae]|nr:hypothetical protein NFI96_007844 [Prochilodus magdalenae]